MLNQTFEVIISFEDINDMPNEIAVKINEITSLY
jgi:hypothetical protein